MLATLLLPEGLEPPALRAVLREGSVGEAGRSTVRGEPVVLVPGFLRGPGR